jgi:hypothetical protein
MARTQNPLCRALRALPRLPRCGVGHHGDHDAGHGALAGSEFGGHLRSRQLTDIAVRHRGLSAQGAAAPRIEPLHRPVAGREGNVRPVRHRVQPVSAGRRSPLVNILADVVVSDLTIRLGRGKARARNSRTPPMD